MAKRKRGMKRDGDYTEYIDRVNGKVRRRRGGPSRKQIQLLPSCAPIRESNSLLGRASKYAALFRAAMMPVTAGMTDDHYVRRTVSVFRKIVKEVRGHAQLQEGEKQNAVRDTTEETRVKCTEEVLYHHLKLMNGFTMNQKATGMYLNMTDSKYSKKKGLIVTLELMFGSGRMPPKSYCMVKGLIRRVDFGQACFDNGEEVLVRLDAPGNYERHQIEMQFKEPTRSSDCFIGFSLQLYSVVNNSEGAHWERTLYGGVVYYASAMTPRIKEKTKA